jgi:hypothetical protein
MSLFIAEKKNSDGWFDYDIAPTHVMCAPWKFLAKKSIMTSTIQHIHRYGPVKLVAIPRTEDHFEAPQISCMLTFWSREQPSQRACRKSASNYILHSKNTCSGDYFKMAETISEVIKYSSYSRIPETLLFDLMSWKFRSHTLLYKYFVYYIVSLIGFLSTEIQVLLCKVTYPGATSFYLCQNMT